MFLRSVAEGNITTTKFGLNRLQSFKTMTLKISKITFTHSYSQVCHSCRYYFLKIKKGQHFPPTVKFPEKELSRFVIFPLSIAVFRYPQSVSLHAWPSWNDNHKQHSKIDQRLVVMTIAKIMPQKYSDRINQGLVKMKTLLKSLTLLKSTRLTDWIHLI